MAYLHAKNKDLSEVDFSDIDELIAKLTPEEIELLNGEVDPDVRFYFSYLFVCLFFHCVIHVSDDFCQIYHL